MESGDVLWPLFGDKDYKRQRAEDRLGRVSGRFASTTLNNERVLLIDDVITSGGQAEECRRQMLAQGARRVVDLALGVTQDTLPRACPKCGGLLRLVTGPYSDFIGCSNFYPLGCRYTERAPSV